MIFQLKTTVKGKASLLRPGDHQNKGELQKNRDHHGSRSRRVEAEAATKRDRASTFGDVTLMKNSVFVPFLCIPRETTKTISIKPPL